VQVGPAMTCVKSMTFTPLNAFASMRYRYTDGLLRLRPPQTYKSCPVT
jgi:hypothetical protein